MCFDILIVKFTVDAFLIHQVNQRKLFVSNDITIMKSRFQKFSNSIYLNFLKCIINTVALRFAIFYMQNSFFLYLMLLLLHRIGKFLAYVAALLVAKFWGF